MKQYFFLLFVILFSLFAFQGTMTGNAVIVLDDGVTADQIAEIAKLASSGDETKMLSEVDLTQGGLLIFTRLTDGDTAAIKMDNGNYYVTGNVHDAVSVMQAENYKQLVEQYDIVEIVNGEIVKEEEIVEEVLPDEAEEELYCEEFDWGVRDYAAYTTPYDRENYCDLEVYAIVYSCYEGPDVYRSVPVTKTTYCPYGCKEGVCLEAKGGVDYGYTCEDTDKGKELYVKGTTTGKDSDGNDFTFEDYCNWGDLGHAFVVEGSCDYTSDTVDYVQYPCEWGCENGACAWSAYERTDYCEQTKDADGRTKVSGLKKSEPYEYTSYCNENDQAVHYYCPESERWPRTYMDTCQHRCEDGLCAERSCEETVDETGIVTITGKEYREEYLRKSYCVGNTLLQPYCDSYGWPSSKNIVCEKGCADGLCKTEGQKVEPGCTDTDGGDVPDVKGEVYGANPAGVPFGPTQDSCFYNKFYKVDQIEEYVCAQTSGVYYAAAKHHDCPGGCEDGVCLLEEKENIVEENIEVVESITIADFLANIPSDTVIVIPSGISTNAMLAAVALAGELGIEAIKAEDYSTGSAIMLGAEASSLFAMGEDTAGNPMLLISPSNKGQMRKAVRVLLDEGREMNERAVSRNI